MSPGGATYPSAAGVILVTEDEVLVRMDVVETLISAGYSVLEASSADEAVKLLDGGKSSTWCSRTSGCLGR